MGIRNHFKRFVTAALLAGALLVSAPVDATSAVLLSRKELVVKSDLVVHATVIDADSAWNEEGTTILTRTRLRVARYAKGAGPSELVVEQIGGTVGDRTVHVAGDGRLSPGQEVALFLKKGEGGYVYLTALAQAAYHVKDGKAQRELDGLTLFVWQNGKLVPAHPPDEKAEPLDKLMSEVARMARSKGAAK